MAQYLSSAPLVAYFGAGVTGAAMAAALNMDIRNVYRYLTRGGRIRWDTADRVACHLGVHPCTIWGDEWFATEDAQPTATKG
jgi:hypothetical protein